MAVFGRKRHPFSTMVASAEPIETDNVAEVQALYLKRQAWQERVWLYYDEIPEIHYFGQFIANALSRIKLVAAQAPEVADDKPKIITDGPQAKAIEALSSIKGGQRALMRNLGLNLVLPGETTLIGYEKDGRQQWEALSISELRVTPGAPAMRFRYPGAQPEYIPKGTLLVRMWREHPRFSSLADSAVAALIDQCEQLLLLTKAEKAAARSRFAGSGLLFIPLELVPPAWQNQGRNQDNAEANPLVKQITEAMMEPLRDESHPSSVVPVMLFGPAEYGAAIRYMSFERPLDKTLVAQKEACLSRIGAGLDLPTEMADGRGLSRANHWSALQISESAFSDHIQPFVELVVDALTEGYYRPALKRAGMAATEVVKQIVWYDASELVTKADQSESFKELHDRIAVSDAALRRELGASDDDAPTEEERNKRIGIKLMQPKLAITGNVDDITEAQPGGPGRNKETSQPPGAPGGAASAAPKSASERRVTGPATQGPKPGTDKHPALKPPAGLVASGAETNLGSKLAHLDLALMQKMRTSGDASLQRSLERAGARLRTKLKGREFPDVPNASLVAAVGPETMDELGVVENDILMDDFADAEQRILEWMASGQQEALDYLYSWLVARGLQDGMPLNAFIPTLQENATVASRMWRDQLLGLARERLYNPLSAFTGPGETDDLSVPASVARQVLLTAGGGTVAPVEAPLTGGLATGRTIREIMAASNIPTDGFIWIYGPGRTSFQGHLQLDGAVFDRMTSPVLQVYPEDAWLRRQHYAPGDHRGCSCVVGPYVPDETDTESLWREARPTG